MHQPLEADKLSTLSTRLSATLHVTEERSLARVSALVYDELTSLRKRLAAALYVTDDGSLARAASA